MKVSRLLDRGVLMSELITVNITYPGAIEDTLSSPYPALPTSKPASAQKSWIWGSAMNTTVDKAGVTFKRVAQVIGAGKNTSASVITVYAELMRGATSLATTNVSVSAGYSWTLYLRGINTGITVNDGDQFDLYLWASATGADYRYNAILPFASAFNFFPGSSYTLINPSFTNIIPLYTLTGGNSPLIQSSTGFRIYHESVNFQYGSITTNKTLNLLIHSSDGVNNKVVGSYIADDYTAGGGFTRSTGEYPMYQRQYMPTTVSYRTGFKFSP